MKLGLCIEENPAVVESAQLAERAGFDYFGVTDCLSSTFNPSGSSAFVGCALAAGATSRIRLLSAVALLPLWPGPLVAKVVSDLAVHTAGRFELGVGVGGHERQDFVGCGIDARERGARLEETLEVMRALLDSPQVGFSGRFTRFEDITVSPRPIRQPLVWMGGRNHVAVRRAAKFADVWFPYFQNTAEFEAGLRAVRDKAAELHRGAEISGALYTLLFLDSDSRRATERARRHVEEKYADLVVGDPMAYVIAGDAGACVERIREYESVGVDHLILAVDGSDPVGWRSVIDMLATDVLPAVRTKRR